MMLWFALLLLLFRAPGSESRLLPEDQLRAAKGLCEGEEAVSDSLISSAAAIFVSRSLLSSSDQLVRDVNDLNVVSKKELLNKLASIQAPSEGNHLVVENHPASSLSNGNNLVAQQHDKQNRVPPAHNSESELFTNLASTMGNSAPSEGEHRLIAEKKNRAPPIHSSESELFNNRASTMGNSAPSGGDHRLIVEKKHRAPPVHSSESELFTNLASTMGNSAPSEGDHRLIAEKKNRAPPVRSSESELFTNRASTMGNSAPSEGDHRLIVEKKNRAPPSFKFESVSRSVPSGGDHLVVEKRNRSPPSFMSESEVSNNLGKRSRSSGPSAPSGGDHLFAEKKSHRSPPGDFQTLALSEPSGETHRLTLEVESKKFQPPPAVDRESEHVRGHQEGQKNREILLKLAGTPSPGNHLVAEGFGKLDSASVPSDPNHLVVENVERNTSPSAGSAEDSDQDELKSVTRQRSPPADHERKATELTDSESSVDTSQKVGCYDSIWDNFENMAQQFAHSVRRISVHS